MRIIVEEMGEKKKKREGREEGKRRRERERVSCYADDLLIVMSARDLRVSVYLCLSVCQ